MASIRPSSQAPAVKCSECLSEIPPSVALSQEADEYTQYFCGLECYTQWKVKHEKNDVNATKEMEKGA